MKRLFIYRVYFDEHRFRAVGAANVREAIQTAREIGETQYSLPPGSRAIKVERMQGRFAKPIKRMPPITRLPG